MYACDRLRIRLKKVAQSDRPTLKTNTVFISARRVRFLLSFVLNLHNFCADALSLGFPVPAETVSVPSSPAKTVGDVDGAPKSSSKQKRRKKRSSKAPSTPQKGNDETELQEEDNADGYTVDEEK